MSVSSSYGTITVSDVKYLVIEFNSRDSNHSNYNCTITLKDSRKAKNYIYSLDLCRLIQDINSDKIDYNYGDDKKLKENLQYVSEMNKKEILKKESDQILTAIFNSSTSKITKESWCYTS